MTHPIEKLWRECGLPEYFLGNGESNTKLYALYDAIRGPAQTAPSRGEIAKAVFGIMYGKMNWDDPLFIHAQDTAYIAADRVLALSSTDCATNSDEAREAMAECPYWNGEKSLTDRGGK